MTTTTPGRLPHRPPARTERRRELRTAALAVAGLLAVLVGVPALLLLAVGNPLPTSLPESSWLTAPVTPGVVLQVLSCGLWLAWAHFAVCVLAEWRAARRGRGTPSEVPLGGGSQVLARRLVAAALLLAGAATLVPQTGAAPAPRPAAVASVVAEQPAPVVAAALQEAAASQAAGPEKTYVVQPPEGRRYDCLWDIAERTLGDPYRYKEIFELNRDRVQDDGRKLVDANLIQPGWVLRMPADARGPGVGVPALAPPQQAPQQAPGQQAPGQQAAGEQAAGDQAAGDEAAGDQAQAPVREDGGLGLERGLAGAGLLAAGVLVALSGRRGPYGRPGLSAAEEQLRLAASPARASLLDRALRTLAAGCAEEGRPLPEVVVAYCDDHQVTLGLAAPAGDPPAPWTSVSDGRGWHVDEADLPPTAPDVAAPYPALAGVALSGQTDVLVDLEGAPGLVSLEGDAAVARDVASSLVVELATNLWSDGVRVTTVGFGDDLSPLAPGSVTTAATLAGVLDGLEDESRRASGRLRDAGAATVLAGRLLRGAERARPHVVVLSGPPTQEEAARLGALVADVRTPLAVLCVGAAPSARWRFTVDADGGIDLGVLGLRARARRLGPDGYLPLLEALQAADRERTDLAPGLAALSPRAALEEVTGAGPGAPQPGAPVAPAPRVPSGPAAAHVRLLGPVEVDAPGTLDPAARPLLTEVVVAAALHPQGLHEAVLRAEVWPRGVSDDVLATTLAQAQAWLGTGADGRPRLRRDDGGRWALAPDVHSDWDRLQAAAGLPDGAGAAAALEDALVPVRGEAFGAPAGALGSLTFHRAARACRLVGTAVARRAATHALDRGDAARAAEVLRAGLALVPAAEPLWRDLLRITGGTDPAGAAGVAREAYEALRARGLRPEPETDALVQQLAPEVLRTTA